MKIHLYRTNWCLNHDRGMCNVQAQAYTIHRLLCQLSTTSTYYQPHIINVYIDYRPPAYNNSGLAVYCILIIYHIIDFII